MNKLNHIIDWLSDYIPHLILGAGIIVVAVLIYLDKSPVQQVEIQSVEQNTVPATTSPQQAPEEKNLSYWSQAKHYASAQEIRLLNTEMRAQELIAMIESGYSSDTASEPDQVYTSKARTRNMGDYLEFPDVSMQMAPAIQRTENKYHAITKKAKKIASEGFSVAWEFLKKNVNQASNIKQERGSRE